MTLRRVAVLLAVAAGLLLAGCGGERGGSDGTALLWVTKDRGAIVMLDTTVDSGQTLLRALRSKADVETRYGGRFVQAIEGVEGSLAEERDWFWFVNGLAGDRSAAEYRLHDGDIAWWDFREWRDDATLAVVVGAFPEPFRHGYGGEVRPAAVRYERPQQRGDAERVAALLGTVDVAPAVSPIPSGANLFELVTGQPRFVAALRTPGAGPSSPVRFTFAGDVGQLLVRDFPSRRRFSLP